MAGPVSIQDLYAALCLFPQLSALPIFTIFTFIQLCLRQWNILTDRMGHPCPTLPDGWAARAAPMLDISQTIVNTCWSALSDYIAHLSTHKQQASLDDLIRRHAIDGVGGDVFEPPVSHCNNETCSHSLHRRPLTDPQTHGATLFTLYNKVLPVRTKSLYCRGCQTRYYPNYYVRNPSHPHSKRIYYSHEVPDILHVQNSKFVKAELCDYFRSLFVSRNAAETIAKIYNETMGHLDIPLNSSLSSAIDPNLIYDAFYLHALLLDKHTHQQPLTLPHNVERNSHRFDPAIQERNLRMVGTGQEMWAHACSLCTHFRRNPNGHMSTLTAVVTDGVTLGHKCCRVLDCHVPLESLGDKHCPHHRHLDTQCAVEGCSSFAAVGSLACDLPDHEQKVQIATQRRYTKRDKENRKRAVRAGELHDPNPESNPATPSPSKRARVAGRSTHNEQLVVRCCGIIISRATFNGSESVAATAALLKATFPSCFPGSLPCFCAYDHNCGLLKHLRAQNDRYFYDCGLPIDVFHFKKGSHIHDEFCQANCSPFLFPELRDEKGEWIFNTSVAEQINVWFGAFLAITRQMGPDRYSFFLDEMIAIHNQRRVVELRQKGYRPHLVPEEQLRAPRTFGKS